MKEAAGEANMTVITIVLIGIVLAVGTVIIKGLMDKTKSTAETQAGGTACAANQYWDGSQCVSAGTFGADGQ